MFMMMNWLITKLNTLSCTVSKASKVPECYWRQRGGRGGEKLSVCNNETLNLLFIFVYKQAVFTFWMALIN